MTDDEAREILYAQINEIDSGLAFDNQLAPALVREGFTHLEVLRNLMRSAREVPRA